MVLSYLSKFINNTVNWYNNGSESEKSIIIKEENIDQLTEKELVNLVLSFPYTIDDKNIQKNFSMSNVATCDWPTVSWPKSIPKSEKDDYYRHYYAIHTNVDNNYLNKLQDKGEYDNYYGDIFIFSSNTEMYKYLYDKLPYDKPSISKIYKNI